MRCSYCGSTWQGDEYHPDICAFCSASKPKPEPIQKYDPFFYDGMIVYALYDPAYSRHEYVFYKGNELVGRVVIPREIALNWEPGVDAMPYITDMLKASINAQA